MSRLTRPEVKRHEQALQYIKELPSITDLDTKENYELYVLENFDPGYTAAHLVVNAGIFFTPIELAKDFRVEAQGHQSVIDLCAGIGHLSYWMQDWVKWDEFELICVEINPEFVAVGKVLVPKASWICADILDPDFPSKFSDRQFDFAIANPPFGKNMSMKKTPHLKYTGASFEFKTIEVASKTAKSGAFIIPQSSSPIIHYPKAGQSYNNDSKEYLKFNKETGICLENNCGIDANGHQWKGAAPKVEIITCDFTTQTMAPRKRNRSSGSVNLPSLFPPE
jgi:predicted RNA methylase